MKDSNLENGDSTRVFKITGLKKVHLIRFRITGRSKIMDFALGGLGRADFADPVKLYFDLLTNRKSFTDLCMQCEDLIS